MKTNGAPVSPATAKTILVVEDEVFIRLNLADDLMDAGFHVIQAASADEALKLFHSRVDIDLVITDSFMPGSMNGLELAGRVRSYRPELKIVVISGNLAGLTADAGTLFIDKPYQSENLIRSVNELLNGKDDEN